MTTAAVRAAPATANGPGVIAEGRYLRQFDLYRAVTCVCVVAQHSVLWPVTASSTVGWGIVMLLHFSRNAFFFLSAFVAYYAQRTRPRPLGALWWRRLSQVMVPYLVWTAAYFAYAVATTSPTAHQLPRLAWTDLWHGYYQLYFVVVLVQFYVLLPVLSWLVERTHHHHLGILAASGALQLGMVSVSHYFSWHAGALGTLRHVDEILLTSRMLVGYQLYLVAGLLAAAHVEEVQQVVARHSRRILVAVAVVAAAALGYYAVGLALGQTPGHASDLYQPVATVWFMAAICGIYTLGWRWAQGVARRPGRRLDRAVTWGSDVSGGFFFAHVLVLQLVLTGLNHTGLRSAGGWGAVGAALFVATLAGTGLLAGGLVRTPLRVVTTGPDRTAERRILGWEPPTVALAVP